MTWPINALEELREAELNGDKATIEAMRKIDWSSLMASQRAYKSAILKSGAIGALFKMLAPRLQKGFRWV
jgi:replication fork protection complex subunit Tof1/Swi1